MNPRRNEWFACVVFGFLFLLVVVLAIVVFDAQSVHDEQSLSQTPLSIPRTETPTATRAISLPLISVSATPTTVLPLVRCRIDGLVVPTKTPVPQTIEHRARVVISGMYVCEEYDGRKIPIRLPEAMAVYDALVVNPETLCPESIYGRETVCIAKGYMQTCWQSFQRAKTAEMAIIYFYCIGGFF